MTAARLLLIRAVVVATTLLGLNYIVWRWLYSVHWAVWWIALPLVLAETYSLIDSLLFGLTVWRLRERPAADPPPPGLSVDVFITTYNEPLELVMNTARAAKAIDYPHTTWLLDDGNRAELKIMAEAEGIGWVSRSPDWTDRPRHAKAGNLNNALLRTDGEFILILDADQVPDPAILDRTLGYFATDDTLALVQTPQYFVNVPDDDPLGSQAPLFYGPIQQGKDGWNAAFFCGSNAVLRREALMQLGIVRYVSEVEQAVQKALHTADTVLDGAIADAEDEAVATTLRQIKHEVRHARSELRRGHGLAEVTYRFQQRVAAATRSLVDRDVAALRADMAVIDELAREAEASDLGPLAALDDAALARMTRRDWSPLGAMETVRLLIEAVDLDRNSEAQAVMPLATISVTEDMATCMRLHGLGWRSVYHHEVLAHGLAPEDLGSMITQRLRWAQGTMQVALRENPLTQKGLTVPQRLMYFATMWSYLSGFAAVVYVAAPVIYLLVGVLPVQAFSVSFFLRLVPFLIVNQLLFFVVARGAPTWRGQQYSLALFPVWIKAVTSACANVLRGRSLGFAVTPKTRQQEDALPWHLVRIQLRVIGVLIFAAVIGILRLVAGQATPLGTFANLLWVVFDLVIFSVIIRAVRYRGFSPERETIPDTTTARKGPRHGGHRRVDDRYRGRHRPAFGPVEHGVGAAAHRGGG